MANPQPSPEQPPSEVANDAPIVQQPEIEQSAVVAEDVAQDTSSTTMPPTKVTATNEELDHADDANESKQMESAPQYKATSIPPSSVTDFITGLTPFISALEDFDNAMATSPKGDSATNGHDNTAGNDMEHAMNNNEGKDGSTDIATADKQRKRKIEEDVMRPIRELIYKSFHEPSEGEEGIEYVINQLQSLKHISLSQSGGNTDLVVRSIGHFLSLSLPPSWIDSMCRWMLDRMQLILLKLMAFKHYCSSTFHADVHASRIFVLQCALHRRFPLLISEGCASLARSPVFYGTKQCSLFNDNNYIRCSWQLLQTGSSFKIIPLHRSTHHHHSHHASSSKRRGKHHSKKTAKGGMVDQEEDVLKQLANENIITPLTMDLRTLEQEIERDQSKGRLPCVVIASPTDNLQKIRSICDRHGLWLHIEGASSSLLLAAATTLPKTTRIMMQCADSISCQPFEWFTVNNVNDGMQLNKLPKSYHANKPKITMKQKTKKVHVSITSNTKKNYFGDDVPGCTSTLTFIKEDLRDTPPPSVQYSDADFVMMFPLWHLLVTKSIKQIKNRVDHSLSLCQYLTQQLLQHKNIFSTSLLSSSLPQIVVFQITPNINVIDLSLFKLDINTFHELLINRCSQEISNLHIEWKLYDDEDDVDSVNMMNVNEDDNRFHYYGSDDGDATQQYKSQRYQQKQAVQQQQQQQPESMSITPYFRFEPLSYAHPESIPNEYISSFIEKIVVEINILRKCLESRRAFQEYIDRDADLEFVDAMNVQTIMIGLGAFRFVPSFFKNSVESESVHMLNKCLCDELNAINTESITQMYKLSMDMNGIVCIVINPTNQVFEQNCCDTIYQQIRKCHTKMKYPQEVMEVMAQAIKSGINNANKVVHDKANADYSVDSIVRKVPLFGSVYGWLLPTGEDEMVDLDDNSLGSNTGIGFQIGVGMTKPQIQRQYPQQQQLEQEEENNTVDSNDNDNVVEHQE
eukprot:CAMPEP_0197033402 /NCGR_PEP_ID=MMETSP1384-20130603/11820_1 /TAXON_ID=29189 /ORGANISM="Ammonia sp." /LENGTH=970 /DNA_ID=CAMNT_0042463207 /DNA_START=32 /DNA_END=2944 /DNA_ORIENTATION=+